MLQVSPGSDVGRGLKRRNSQTQSQGSNVSPGSDVGRGLKLEFGRVLLCRFCVARQ